MRYQFYACSQKRVLLTGLCFVRHLSHEASKQASTFERLSSRFHTDPTSSHCLPHALRSSSLLGIVYDHSYRPQATHGALPSNDKIIRTRALVQHQVNCTTSYLSPQQTLSMSSLQSSQLDPESDACVVEMSAKHKKALLDLPTFSPLPSTTPSLVSKITHNWYIYYIPVHLAATNLATTTVVDSTVLWAPLPAGMACLEYI